MSERGQAWFHTHRRFDRVHRAPANAERGSRAIAGGQVAGTKRRTRPRSARTGAHRLSESHSMAQQHGRVRDRSGGPPNAHHSRSPQRGSGAPNEQFRAINALGNVAVGSLLRRSSDARCAARAIRAGTSSARTIAFTRRFPSSASGRARPVFFPDGLDCLLQDLVLLVANSPAVDVSPRH